MSESVLLLHGIWMGAFQLGVLARRLRAAGFAPESFGYASLGAGPEAALPRLAERIAAHAPGPVHLVGHSLGGLVALEAARVHRGLPIGRIVCLGTPLAGSAAARGLLMMPGGALLLGRSAQLLERGGGALDGGHAVGMIAGRLPLGLGALFGGFDDAHDGSVMVRETEAAGLADHRTIATSHTGLLFSDAAARLTAAFLRDGRFP